MTRFRYNIKKALISTALLALPFSFGGCEKPEKEEPTNKPKIVTLKFDKNGHHIELDTIRYYLAQGADSIYMVANPHDMFAPQSTIHNATLFLGDRCNLSPKVRGHDKITVNPATDPADREDLKNMGFNVVLANTKSNQYQ